MTYVALNNEIYSAAYAGAMSQCVIRTGQSPNLSPPPVYTSYTAIADAWAQAVDIAWAGLPSSNFQNHAIETESETYHTTHPVAPADLAAAALPAYWTIPATAIVAAVNTAVGPTAKLTITERTPGELYFTTSDHIWMDNDVNRMVPASLRVINENFADTTLARFTTIDATQGARSIAANTFTITNPGDNAFHTTYNMEGVDLTMPQICAVADVTSITGAYANGLWPQVGICKDINNFIVAERSMVSGNMLIVVKIGGVATNFIQTAVAGLTPPFSIALVIVGQFASLYYRQLGNGATNWQRLSTGTDISAAVDPRTMSWVGWKGMFGCASGSAANVITVSFQNFYVGRFGGTKIRGFHPIRNLAGVPITSGNNIYFTSILAGDPPTSQSSIGVILYNPTNQQSDLQAVWLVNDAGGIHNYIPGTMILDGDNQHIFLTKQTDAPVITQHILYKLISAAGENLLTGSHILTAMTQLNLTQGADQNDSAPVKIGATWYLGYSASIQDPPNNWYFPCLDSSPDLVNWTNVMNDPIHQYEGNGICLIAGNYYLSCVCGYHTNSAGIPVNNGCRLYNVPAGTFYGYLPAQVPVPSDWTNGGEGHIHPFIYQDVIIALSHDATNSETDSVFGHIRHLCSPRYKIMPTP